MSVYVGRGILRADCASLRSNDKLYLCNIIWNGFERVSLLNLRISRQDSVSFSTVVIGVEKMGDSIANDMIKGVT